MKRTITESEFIDGFTGSYADSFTYEGKKALYEYFTELEEDTSFEIEYDPIAIHCEYTEYDDFTEFRDEYEDYVYEHKIKDLETLQEHTQVIEYKGGFIIQQF